jgi:D-xylonolactonase
MSAAAVPVWRAACMLGEGPVWADDKLWFVDILGRRIHAFNPVNGQTRTWLAPEPVGFLHPIADGGFVAGLKSGLFRFDPTSGAFAELVRLDSAAPDCRINDGAVDPAGHLWFGTLDETERQASGVLYRLDEDGLCRPRDKGYIVTNGPAFSPDGKTLYHTDTLSQTIYAFDLARDGALSDKRVFARIERPGVYPDGPTVDEEGCLWSGLFGGWGVERYAPTGERLAFFEFPCSRVTKLAFGGPGLGTAYVTTARKGLSAADLEHEPDAGALFAFETGTRGMPTPRIAHGVTAIR